MELEQAIKIAKLQSTARGYAVVLGLPSAMRLYDAIADLQRLGAEDQEIHSILTGLAHYYAAKKKGGKK